MRSRTTALLAAAIALGGCADGGAPGRGAEVAMPAPEEAGLETETAGTPPERSDRERSDREWRWVPERSSRRVPAELPRAPVPLPSERPEGQETGPTAIPDCEASTPAPGSVLGLEEGPAPVWDLVAEGSGLATSVTWTIGDTVVGPFAAPPATASFDWATVVPKGAEGPVEVPITLEARDASGRTASCSYSVFVEVLEVCRFPTAENTGHWVVPLEDLGSLVWNQHGGELRDPACGGGAEWKAPGGFAYAAWWDEACRRPIFLFSVGGKAAELSAMAGEGCAAWTAGVPWAVVAGPTGATVGHVWLVPESGCIQAWKMSDGEAAGPPFCPGLGETLQFARSTTGTLVVRSEGGLLARLDGGEVTWTANVPAADLSPNMTVVSPDGSRVGAAIPDGLGQILYVFDAEGALVEQISGYGPWAVGDDGTVVGMGPTGPGNTWPLVGWKGGKPAWEVPSPFYGSTAARFVEGDRIWLFADSDEGVSKLRAFRLTDGAAVRSLEVKGEGAKTHFAFGYGFVWLARKDEVIKLRTDPVGGAGDPGEGP